MTTRAKGTGLGLAIVYRITEQHGGTLTLADAPKRNGKIEGASVRIDLPVRRQGGGRRGARPGPSRPKSQPSAPKRRRE